MHCTNPILTYFVRVVRSCDAPRAVHVQPNLVQSLHCRPLMLICTRLKALHTHAQHANTCYIMAALMTVYLRLMDDSTCSDCSFLTESIHSSLWSCYLDASNIILLSQLSRSAAMFSLREQFVYWCTDIAFTLMNSIDVWFSEYLRRVFVLFL